MINLKKKQKGGYKNKKVNSQTAILLQRIVSLQCLDLFITALWKDKLIEQKSVMTKLLH